MSDGPDLLPGVTPPPLDPEWWRGAVIRQIYPRSIQDSDGDGVGDLAAIARRLDHMAALGADALWISPFVTNLMKDFGYDVSDCATSTRWSACSRASTGWWRRPTA